MADNIFEKKELNGKTYYFFKDNKVRDNFEEGVFSDTSINIIMEGLLNALRKAERDRLRAWADCRDGGLPIQSMEYTHTLRAFVEKENKDGD